MKYLLHCIVEKGLAEAGSGKPRFDTPEREICIVAGYGLAAVASREEMLSAPTIAQLLDYDRVIEDIHARQTALPFRYGCLMDGESEILRLLEENHERYKALLSRLHAMTEMGIRLLWPAHAAAGLPPSPTPGAAYLASLRQRYNVGDALTQMESGLADGISTLLAHQFTSQRREASSSGQGRLVSIAFLTPRVCVEEFRNKARELTPPEGAKLLVSGPWPPYNFVASDA